MALFIALWALLVYSVLSWSATAGLIETAHWNLSVERSRLTTMVVSSLAVEPIPSAAYDVLMVTVPLAVDDGPLSIWLLESCVLDASASFAVREVMTRL
nr:hypothetical protein [Actinomyces oris]